MNVFNTTDHYRLAAVMELARVYPAQLSGATIARRCKIPRAYLSRLVPEMVHRGLLRSRRGPGGGLSLADDPGALTLDRLVTFSPREETVSMAGARLSARLQETLSRELENLTLAEVASWNHDDPPQPDYVI